MKIPYPVVNSKKPFFYITVSGIDLSTITTVGGTEIHVYRVSKDNSLTADYINYSPIESKKNKFTFVFDDGVFLLEGGRYRADFYYSGTYISSTVFVYDKNDVIVAGSANV